MLVIKNNNNDENSQDGNFGKERLLTSGMLKRKIRINRHEVTVQNISYVNSRVRREY